ncbi:granulocyte-macrophage colony-stimulating factor receptor subunit alpha-like isoform X2 [Nerophis lumbriciformis]|uniref:granulocyte-macrophage colony-stimulating factor receptor subunit alpha-like isoform X2 n=1 Tax=Nerophis lumbriciformis TaxID=546530 RepID=UPI002ADFD90B|nr:interleukin-5 receptor subunit alpha-like isoform X2 [Nerophis lumbriciformis]
MKLLHPVFCYGLLVLWAYQSGATNPEVCQEDKSFGDLQLLSSSGPQYELLDIDKKKNFNCSLHPTNVLNCSWSFLTVQPGTRIQVYISVCNDTSTVRPCELVSDEPFGGTSMALGEYVMLEVVLHFNVSQGHTWAVYSYMYDIDMMEVLLPPGNISASVDDHGLVVSWELPYSRATPDPSCFEYELDVGDKESPKVLSGQLSYAIPNVDPSAAYAVRVRARKDEYCSGMAQWSRWSNTVTIEQSFDTVNVTVIVLIALGIPMILLALLMVFRHQRLAEVLYPPIPRPPLKYKHFLEDNNIINFYHPALSVKCEEEITVVEETEQKTF